MDKNKTIIPVRKVTKSLLRKILFRYFRVVNDFEFKIISRATANMTVVVKVGDKRFVVRIYSRYLCDEHKMILRKKQDILWELDFMEQVRKVKVPVPEVIRSLKGERLINIEVDGLNYYVVVFEYIKGHHLKRLTKSQAKEIVYYQALLHKIFKRGLKTSYKKVQLNQFSFETWAVEDCKWKLKKWPKNKNLILELRKVVIALRAELTKAIKGYRKIPIHHDLNLENIKFLNGKVSGIFDFDDVLIGVPIVELGQTLYFVTKKIKKPGELNRKLDSLIEYYSRINKISGKDKKIVKLAFILFHVAHNLFFFEGRRQEVERCRRSLEFYRYLRKGMVF